jgi:hypothetical protein
VIPLVVGAVVGRAAAAAKAPRRPVPVLSGRLSTNTGRSGRGGPRVTTTDHRRSKSISYSALLFHILLCSFTSDEQPPTTAQIAPARSQWYMDYEARGLSSTATFPQRPHIHRPFTNLILVSDEFRPTHLIPDFFLFEDSTLSKGITIHEDPNFLQVVDNDRFE